MVNQELGAVGRLQVLFGPSSPLTLLYSVWLIARETSRIKDTGLYAQSKTCFQFLVTLHNVHIF